MSYDVYVEGEISALRDVEGLMKKMDAAPEDARYFCERAFGELPPHIGGFTAELKASAWWGQEVAAFLAPHMDAVIKMFGEDESDWKFVLAEGDYQVFYREEW